MALRRADDLAYTLGTGLSATGNAVAVKGGEYMFFAEGTLTSGQVSLEIQSPSGTWVTVQVFTNALVRFTTLPGNQAAIDLPPCNVRVAVSGVASGVAAYLVGCG